MVYRRAKYKKQGRISVGDIVRYRGQGPTGTPAGLTKVLKIEVTEPGEKYGESVESVPLSLMKQDRVVLDLDNGHWAKPYRIELPRRKSRKK